MGLRRISLCIGLAGLVTGPSAAGCSEWGLPETSGTPTSSHSSTSTGSTGVDPTSSTTSGSTGAEPTSSGSGSSSTGAPPGGMCNVYDQDCPKGQKCTGYGDPGTYIPDGIKCVPVAPDPIPDLEPCIVGPAGLGDDRCDVGAVCLDVDADGNGFCLPYCTGNSDAPICEDDRTCVKLFFGFNFGNCFKKCDPLVQDCNIGEGCYMDAIKAGNTGFVCLPVAPEGESAGYHDGCFGWSSCSPGFACVFEEFVPGCTGLCCTSWCDLTDADPCSQFDPVLTCVPWFSPNTAPPGFENVGICAVPA